MKETAHLHEKMLAMNEALILGSVRQHELTEAAENLNTQLQNEVAARQKIVRELAEKARLLDLTHDAIIVRDLKGNIKTWNMGAQKLYGWTSQEVVGKNLHTMLNTEFPKTMEDMLAQLDKEGEFSGEVVQIARNGRRVPSLCRWVLDREAGIILATYTDISDRKAAELEMVRARDEALAASTAKDNFLAALSHELRTPLNPVLLIATESVNDADLPAAVRADFGIIAKNVLLEARLIDDLLDLTKITHGKMPIELRRLDIHAVLRDAITTMGNEFEEKKLRLKIDLTPEPCAVLGDSVRLQQVFWNVLKNAVKFTQIGGAVHIVTRTDKAAEKIKIEITDSGVGMSPDELGRIFIAFSQGDHAVDGTSHRFGGLGLGLTISQRLVQLHSGQLKAVSEGQDCGTTFTIQLPIAAAGIVTNDSNSPVPQTLSQAIYAPSAIMRRILLIEDHDATRNSLTILLCRRGYAVVNAATVGEALIQAEKQPFDLVISDIGLPDGDGFSLMSKLRDQYGLKGIAMTGYGMEQDIARAYAAGYVTHITKPASIQNLESAIAKMETELKGTKRENA